jgi:hypothetical protein
LESNKDKAFSASDHFVWQCITRCGGGGCAFSHIGVAVLARFLT